MEIANHLKMIEHEPHHWRVVYPYDVLANEELFMKGKDLHNSNPIEAERIYRQVMANCGELYIDALTHLGIILNKRMEGTGLTYIIQAYTHSRTLFPDEFEEGKDFLLYESRGNAFVLTAYYTMAYELMKVKKWKESLEIFEFLMLINPKDNYGASRWIPQLKEKIKAQEAEEKITKNN